MLAVLALAGAHCRNARAEDHCDGTRPWVSVVFARGEWTRDFEGAVLRDLDAGLAARGIAACRDESDDTSRADGRRSGESREPAAVVTLRGQPGSDVSLSVEVTDSVTHKRVARGVDLSSVPSDGRAFALALAIDELVWATWAELALDPERERHRSAPVEVMDAVERELPRSDTISRLGLRGAVEHLPGELTLVGGDALFLPALSSRAAFELAASVRLGPPEAAPHGEVGSRALGLAMTLRYELVSSSAVALDVGLGVRALLLQFRAAADAGARARDFADLSVDARGLGYARVPLALPLSLELGAGLGWPLRTVVVTDAGSEVGGVRGPELLGSVGLLVDL